MASLLIQPRVRHQSTPCCGIRFRNSSLVRVDLNHKEFPGKGHGSNSNGLNLGENPGGKEQQSDNVRSGISRLSGSLVRIRHMDQIRLCDGMKYYSE